MHTDNQLKEVVKEKYAQIALQDKATNTSSCCGSGCCTSDVASIMNDEYNHLEGYNPDADLGLGCGLPTESELVLNSRGAVYHLDLRPEEEKVYKVLWPSG